MPALFISALIGALATAMGSLAGRALLALGFGAITYTGLTVAINSVKSSLVSSFNSLPADAVGLLGYLWVDKSLTIIFSAVTAALAMRLTNGAIKKMVMK